MLNDALNHVFGYELKVFPVTSNSERCTRDALRGTGAVSALHQLASDIESPVN